jgi:hypothetical protein
LRPSLVEQRTPTLVYGDEPHVHEGRPMPTGLYAVFRCPQCTNIHVSVVGKPIFLEGKAPLMQLGMSAHEARQFAAALLEFAEGH